MCCRCCTSLKVAATWGAGIQIAVGIVLLIRYFFEAEKMEEYIRYSFLVYIGLLIFLGVIILLGVQKMLLLHRNIARRQYKPTPSPHSLYRIKIFHPLTLTLSAEMAAANPLTNSAEMVTLPPSRSSHTFRRNNTSANFLPTFTLVKRQRGRKPTNSKPTTPNSYHSPIPLQNLNSLKVKIFTKDTQG